MGEAMQEHLVGGFVALGVVALLIGLIYTYGVRPHLSHFKAKGLRVILDRAQGVAHIESDQSAKPHQVRLGCGAYEFQRHTKTLTRNEWQSGCPATVNIINMGNGAFATGSVNPGTPGWWKTIQTVVPTGVTTMTLHQLDPIPFYHTRWSTFFDGTVSDREHVTTLTLPNSIAEHLRRWVHAHRKQLTPNEKQIRQKWDQTCKRLRRECQRHASVRALPRPLELVELSPAPEIRYLALGRDGKGILKSLRSGEFTPVDFGQLHLTDTSLQYGQDIFRLEAVHIEKLHSIRRRWQKHHKAVA